MAADKPLHPFVYWAQTDMKITLKIDLRNVQSPVVDLKEKSLEFSAIGVGAQGEKKYSAFLDFYGYIDTDNSQYRILDRHVEFSLIKINSEFWERLLEDPIKHAWLKIDFDKWVHEEDLSEEARDIMDDYPDLFDKIKGEEMGWTSKRESIKKVYLFLYNLWQFVGFLYIMSVMVTRYIKDGPDSMEGTYDNVWKMMSLCLATQFLEVFHNMAGYSKGSVVEALMQTCMRAMIFFCLIQGEERMQTKPVIFYLFLVWSMIELVRYPYYMLRVYDVEIGFLTWLRYTIWIPLYPLGFIFEGVVMLRDIPYFEETEKFTMTLPNSLNFGFHFPSLLRIYLLFFFFPAMYKMMTHMYYQRVKKLGPKSWKKEFEKKSE